MKTEKHLAIPSICKNSNLLMIIIITELIVMFMWLSTSVDLNWVDLGLWSFYAQWLVTLTCLCLCLLRTWISKQPYVIAFIVVTTICLAVLFIGELTIFQMTLIDNNGVFDWPRFIRLAAACLIVVAMVLRFFSLLEEAERRNKAETESRVEALQSRIQPHFLFNSLNTISELIAIKPEAAEKAVGSLSILFRASLENGQRTHSLESEIRLCRRYLELETWRLQNRLLVQWNLQIENANRWEVPKLILQPLIENAVLHGVADDGFININIDIRETRRELSLLVENSKGTHQPRVKGHGVAVDNIRERLIVLYDDKQRFRIKNQKDKYSVFMQIPKLSSSHSE